MAKKNIQENINVETDNLSKKEKYDLEKKKRLESKKKSTKKSANKAKKKNTNTNLGTKIFAIAMLILMLGSIIVSVLAYVM